MKTVTSKAIAKVAAVATGLALASSMLSLAPMAHAAALSDAQVQSILSLLSSFGADASTIANVQASLTGGTPTSTGSGSVSSSCSFTGDLTVGSKGAEVTCLQNALIAAGYSIPAGATGYFGSQTVAAVSAWQKAAGVSPAAGYFGSISRAAFKLGSSTGSTGSTGGTGSTGPSAGTGTGLKVSVSATSPNGSALVAGQGIGNLGEFTFANPTASPINVTGLTFNRIGVSNDETMTNVYLYNAGKRLTDSAGISGGQFSYSDASGIFTVPAGMTYTVAVRSDIKINTAGQQIGVSLVAVSSTGTLDSSVSFPVSGGLQAISSATLASVNFTNANATPSANTTLSAQNDYPLWQNSVSISSNPVKLSSLKFTNLGSVNASDVVNLRLYIDGVQVGPTVASLAADRSVTFDLTSAPAALTTSSHVVKVLGNVLSAGASRTIQLSVQRSADAMFIDQQLNQPVTPLTASNPFAAVKTGVIEIQSAQGGVSVSRAAASPTQAVAVAASSVKWASFDMLASGEDVKVQDLYVYADTSSSNLGLDNGKIYVNGVQVGSTKDIVEGAGDSVAYGSATDFSLGSSLILPAGQTTTIDVYADAKTSTSVNLANNETVTIYLSAGSSNGQGQASYTSVNVPSANTSGNTVTVSTSSLTATKYSGYGDQTVVAGANNAKLGAFTLSTGSTEGVTVNTITLTSVSALSSTVTNLTLKDESTGNMIGSIITTPSTNNSYAVNFSIPVSSTKTIGIYGNVLSGANSGTIKFTVTTSTTGTGDSTNQTSSVASDAPLQAISLGTGTLTVTRGAGDPVSNNVLAGASSVSVGQFSFSAANSSYTVNDLAILIPNGAATSVTNVTVSYKDLNGAPKTATQALAVDATKAFATATFKGLGMYVPTNDSANIDVMVGTPTIASGAVSGAAINVTLVAKGAGIFLAQNSAGSTITQVTAGDTSIASNGMFYVRKSIPTFAMLSSNASAPSSPLYRFSITADPAGPVEWTKLKFSVATSTATLTGVYLTDEASGTNLLDNSATSASTTATDITVDLTKNATQPKYQQIAAGATKTYDLFGTVAGFTTGSTLTISLASDSGPTTNAAAASVSGSVVWSDRAATSHTIDTTDWTNGYLLKNFTTNSVTYSK